MSSPQSQPNAARAPQLIRKSNKLDNVCYTTSSPVLKAADQLEAEVCVLKLNISNPAPWGFNAPEEIFDDVIRNVPQSQGYCDSKGLYSARKAVMQYCQQIQITNVDVVIFTSTAECLN